MHDKIKRIRCGTKKCLGFVDTNVIGEPKSSDGNWQFHCATCSFWSLASADGVVKATSREPFDLERLPTHLRVNQTVRRESPGGV